MRERVSRDKEGRERESHKIRKLSREHKREDSQIGLQLQLAKRWVPTNPAHSVLLEFLNVAHTIGLVEHISLKFLYYKFVIENFRSYYSYLQTPFL